MMWLLTTLLLAGSVAAHPTEAYTVYRQDFVWNERTTPIPYQAYSARQDGVYRVDRQEYGKAHQPFASTTDFRLPRTDYGQNQYWYPTTVGYDHREYQPNAVLSPPFFRTSGMPKLFVPTPDQVFKNSIPVSSVLRPPTTPQTILRTSTKSIEDDPVLPAVPESPVDEGEPLSALPDHSKRTSSSRPISYSPVDEFVEVNEEQRDLLNTYYSATKPIYKTEETVWKSQRSPRVRRDLYSSYPMSFGDQIETHPLPPQMYFNVYKLYFDEDLAKNTRARIEPDSYSSQRSLFDVDDLPTTSENSTPQYPAVVEDNKNTDDVVEESVSTSETYAAYHPFVDPEILPEVFKNTIIHDPDDVVVMWVSPQEPVVSTSETPTTNLDDYEYADLRDEETSETSPDVACTCAGEVETELVTVAAPDIAATENPEWTTIEGVVVSKSVLREPKDIMNALFGISKTTELPRNEMDYDHEQDDVLELQNPAESLALNDRDALKQLLGALSVAPEIQIEFSDEDVRFLGTFFQLDDIFISATDETPIPSTTFDTQTKLSEELTKFLESIARQVDDVMTTSTTTETPAIEPHEDREHENELRVLELLSGQARNTLVIPTTETVAEISVTEPRLNDDDEMKILEYASYLVNRAATTTVALENVAVETITENYSKPSTKPVQLSLEEAIEIAFGNELFSSEETSSPLPVSEIVNVGSEETLMLDIVRQEPEVSLAFGDNRRK